MKVDRPCFSLHLTTFFFWRIHLKDLKKRSSGNVGGCRIFGRSPPQNMTSNENVWAILSQWVDGSSQPVPFWRTSVMRSRIVKRVVVVGFVLGMEKHKGHCNWNREDTGRVLGIIAQKATVRRSRHTICVTNGRYCGMLSECQSVCVGPITYVLFWFPRWIVHGKNTQHPGWSTNCNSERRWRFSRCHGDTSCWVKPWKVSNGLM